MRNDNKKKRLYYSHKMFLFILILSLSIFSIFLLCLFVRKNRLQKRSDGANIDKDESSQFIDHEITHVIKDINDPEHASYIASKIRSRLCGNDCNHDDINYHNIKNNNNDSLKHINVDSSGNTLLSIRGIHVRLTEKGENKKIISLSALYLIKANIIQGNLPISIRIIFYRLDNKEAPFCYMDTVIRSLGEPIILKEISKYLFCGENYRVRIESGRYVFYDDIVHVDSPFPEMIPVLICRDAILLKCNSQAESPYKMVEYSPSLFTLDYLTSFPKLLPNKGMRTNRQSVLEPIPGKTSGHRLLYAKDPICFDGSLSFSDDESDGIVNADLTLIKNAANPIECYVLLRRASPANLTTLNIKGWIVNYRSSDNGTEYKQIFSLTACIEKYYSSSKFEIKPRENLRDIKPEKTVIVWNTDKKIGIEHYDDNSNGVNTTALSNDEMVVPKDPSFFQRDPFIVLDKETGECIMITLGLGDNDSVPLNPRWASSPCSFTSRDNLLVINPQRNHHFSPFVSNVLIFRGVAGGHSFTSQQGKSHYSFVIVDRDNESLPSLHLPVILEKEKFCVHIQQQQDDESKTKYSLVENFPRSLPLETTLDATSNFISKIYAREPSSTTTSSFNKTYTSIGIRSKSDSDDAYNDLIDIIDEDNEKRTCTVFAIGLRKSRFDESPISDTIARIIRSSIPDIVSVTDMGGIEIARSKNIIVNNTCILIILKNIHIDGSSQRWVSSTPFGLGPCKLSGRCGILGNRIPLYTVDHILPVCKVFSYRSAGNITAKNYTVYLSNTCANGRDVSVSDTSEIIALYLSSEMQGKRIVLNAVALKCNTILDDDNKKPKIFLIPSKEMVGGGAEGATSIIILDRVIYVIMATVTTNIQEERRYFAKHGIFTPGSVILDDQFVRRHRNIMKYN